MKKTITLFLFASTLAGLAQNSHAIAIAEGSCEPTSWPVPKPPAGYCFSCYTVVVDHAVESTNCPENEEPNPKTIIQIVDRSQNTDSVNSCNWTLYYEYVPCD